MKIKKTNPIPHKKEKKKKMKEKLIHQNWLMHLKRQYQLVILGLIFVSGIPTDIHFLNVSAHFRCMSNLYRSPNTIETRTKFPHRPLCTQKMNRKDPTLFWHTYSISSIHTHTLIPPSISLVISNFNFLLILFVIRSSSTVYNFCISYPS